MTRPHLPETPLTKERLRLESLRGAPVVAPERGQNGAILACGCWTAHVLVGMRAGSDAVDCPNGHGSSLIARANVDEFPSAPVVAPEENCPHLSHSGVDPFRALDDPQKVWRCDECGALSRDNPVLEREGETK